MKKVYIDRFPLNQAWGGGNMFVKAMFDHCNDFNITLTNDINDNYDVALLTSLDDIQKITKPIILRVNENDARKNTLSVDLAWVNASKKIYATIFVSNYLKKYFMSKYWQNHINSVVYNGVDKQIFKPNSKFNNNKINIVTHHWSNNPLKGFDVYHQLDEFVGKNKEKFTFTYIGRELGNFKYSKIIKPLFGAALGAELGKYDIYVSASRFDPGPNHILEAISCKLPTFVYQLGGGAVEFINDENFVFSSFNDLIDKITNRNINFNESTYDSLNSWEYCVSKYCNILCSI